MFRIERESPPNFDDYARVSIAFEVRTVLDVRETSATGEPLVITEHDIPTPYVKDYDAPPGEDPTTWPGRFDTTQWGVFAARERDERIGGAVGIMGPPELDMLEARTDLAVLWDIRVASASRGRGVGVQLLRAVETWALDRGARMLKVETQDINAPACRFYERNGFGLRVVSRNEYPDFPNEAQLLWYKKLDAGAR